MTIDEAMVAAAEAGARRALEQHLPRLTLSRSEAAEMLGVSTTTVARLTSTGELGQVAAGRITLASVLALAGWPMAPAPVAAPLAAIPATVRSVS